MRQKLLLIILALLLLPALLSAYTIVLKNGQRIEAQGRYVVEGNVAKFTDAGGRQRQIPLAEIDVAATERANAPAGETRRKPKVWTNDEIELLVRGAAVSVSGTVAEPAAETAGGEAAGEAAAEGEPQPLPPKEQTQEYWQDRLRPLREELAKVEEQLQRLRSGRGQAASNAIDVNANAPGVDVQDTIRRLEQRRGEIQQQIEAVQTEARRAGVPSGWVR